MSALASHSWPSRHPPDATSLDELAATGLRPAVRVADTGYGANADFRRGLEDRALAYVLQTRAR
ncbi:transposase [Streptomyces sp. NPDC059819]|uniref:transposase n=1 Tax=Streptomyces sp. NPDC059819 TaxID=3346963 RepID=UPI0036659C02